MKATLSKKEKRIWNTLVVVGAILIVASILFNKNAPKREEPKVQSVSFEGVERIFELTSIRAYYHNVAEETKQPDGLFKFGWFHYGYKKFFMEYDGIVDIGIDSVEIGQPDDEGRVKVYLPDSKVLAVKADINSIGKVWNETGKFTTISTEDQSEVFSAAQQDMKEKAQKDKLVLDEANKRNKNIIEEYVVNVGKVMGKDFKIVWVDSPDEVKEH